MSHEFQKIKEFIASKKVYWFGLAIIITALPLSLFLMSVGQFIILLNWLFSGRLNEKLREFFFNLPAVTLSGIFLIHFLGIIWTTDLSYALKDLRIKLPLLVLPLVISTSPRLSTRDFNWLMILFILACVVASLFGFHRYITGNYTDIRQLSMFISHIRFGLNISLAILSGIYLFFRKDKLSGLIRWPVLIFTAWLAVYLIISESITGLVVSLVAGMVIGIYLIIRIRLTWVKWGAITLLLMVPVIIFWYLWTVYQSIKPDGPFFHPELEQYTARGNPYLHDSTIIGIENRQWVGQYVCLKELDQWNHRSRIPIDSLDGKGNPLKFTLIRYMTSKGLRKDADGLAALTEEDIQAVEKGIPSVDYIRYSGLKLRVRILIRELELYRLMRYVTGGTIPQRLEFWKAGWHIIRENFWWGVGTGDIDQAFRDTYRKINSPLPENQWWRTHNQYLTVWATLGIFGLITFGWMLVYPPCRLKMWNDYFFMVFYTIALTSMISGDTLDTQAGVTFFSFFSSLFLFGRSQKDQISDILPGVPS